MTCSFWVSFFYPNAQYHNKGSTKIIYTLNSKNPSAPAQACLLEVILSGFLEQASELHAQMMIIISYF